jgi:hypothetical protein
MPAFRLPSLLELDGALHGVDCATELQQRAVVGHFEDAALMVGNHRLEHSCVQGWAAGMTVRHFRI